MSVEVLATPSEVLQRLLRERPLWQTELQQEKVLETLDKQTDVYQYSCRNMAPQPSCDYVVLRSGSVTGCDSKRIIEQSIDFQALYEDFKLQTFKLRPQGAKMNK